MKDVTVFVYVVGRMISAVAAITCTFLTLLL